jgi:hypothetical protein
VQEHLERTEPCIDALLADREQFRLGPVDGLLDLGRILVADPGDPAGGADEVAEDSLALDDASVLGGMDSGRGLVAETRKVRAAAIVSRSSRRSSASATVTMSIGSRRSNRSRIAA